MMCRRDLHSQWQRQQVLKLSHLSALYDLIFESLTLQKRSTEIFYFFKMYGALLLQGLSMFQNS